jgi:plastocyanin
MTTNGEHIMRRTGIFVSSVFALVASVCAHAADHTVSVGGNGLIFTPAELTIAVGDTVTFVNAGGFHNAVSDTGAVTAFRCANGCDATGGDGDASGSSWTASVAFPTAGTAPYHCEIHEGSGMVGTITIAAPAAPAIVVDPTAIEAAAAPGATTASAFTIGNTGTADLTWTANTSATTCDATGVVPWLSVAPASGTVATGAQAATVDVTLDASALDAGVYNASICVQSNDTAAGTQQVSVQFNVAIPDEIFLDGFDG